MIVLEAVVSQDLWFWHVFFGMPGLHNDINVLDVSPLFTNLLNGVTPKCSYTINGNNYHQGYFLADGIYPDYSTLVEMISQPQGLERKVRKTFKITNDFALITSIFSSSILPKCRKPYERMWHELLGFSRRDFQL
jgi:hypothetical protein